MFFGALVKLISKKSDKEFLDENNRKIIKINITPLEIVKFKRRYQSALIAVSNILSTRIDLDSKKIFDMINFKKAINSQINYLTKLKNIH